MKKHNVKLKIGDRVVILGDSGFPQGTKGAIQEPPKSVMALAPEGEWEGRERYFTRASAIAVFAKGLQEHWDRPTLASNRSLLGLYGALLHTTNARARKGVKQVLFISVAHVAHRSFGNRQTDT